jgi:hypothetical protein
MCYVWHWRAGDHRAPIFWLPLCAGMLGDHQHSLGGIPTAVGQIDTSEDDTQHIPFFTEAALITAWELWKMCNDKVFQRHKPSPTVWLSNFKNQCYLQFVRFKDDLRSSFCVWLDTFS